MQNAWLMRSLVTGALSAVMLPIVTLLVLAPSQYGQFSTIYLVYAFGLSLQLSIISEAWARRRSRPQEALSWAQYSGAQLGLCVAVAMLCLVLSQVMIGNLLISVLFATGAGSAVYQAGARYFSLSNSEYRKIVASDILAITFALLPIFLFWSEADDLTVISIIWACSGVLSSIPFGLPSLTLRNNLVAWIGKYKTEIRPLLIDSTLMDLSAIGAPLLLAGFLGVRNFGIYRAVSNVSMPVRLILNPIRAKVGSRPPSTWWNTRGVAITLGIALVLAGGAYAVLLFLVPFAGDSLQTIAALRPYALPTAVFVFASFVSHFHYIVARINGRPIAIGVARIVQTVSGIVLPIGGAIIGELSGAIWGYAIATLLAAIVWAGASLESSRK